MASTEMASRVGKATPKIAVAAKAVTRLKSAAAAGSKAAAAEPSSPKPAPRSESAPAPAAAPSQASKAPEKVARHVDAKVAARNSALNAMGGVKVDVFVRVRPKVVDIEGDQPEIVSVNREEMNIELMDPTGHPAKYTYDKVYDPYCSQEELYNDCVSPIVEQVCRGLSCCVFAYGQTGAGKTFTMRGDLSGNPEKYGIIQRSLNHLLSRLQEHEYSEIGVKCSFLEIYNEELEDLFVPPPKVQAIGPVKKAKSKLMLVDDDVRGCMCKGLVEIPVENLDQVMRLLEDAEAQCKYSETKMNKWSNRAHRIFTLIVKFKRYETAVEATLTFVDLAGSEDIAKSGATGLTAREASHINKSLLTLGRVINALACNEKHIPYRDSKLTRLLSEALGGVCKTSFIACISPCSASSVETNSTLRYAERAMEALNISQLPRWKQDEIMIDGLTRRVQQLLDDLENMNAVHREEMNLVCSERDTLRVHNKQLQKDIGKANRKIERLISRKGQLKTGLSLMTQQRDLLQTQKDALRDELLETRKVRDGYLADRSNLNTVMASVRAMRDRLLKAHSKTEGALTKDALKLKGVIEGAIEDIDELHAEVSRKKALSTHNETLADDFRDRMSSKLRAIVQTVGDFKSSQDESYSALNALLSDMRNARQREAGFLRNELSRLSSSATTVYSEITQHANDTEAGRKSRIARQREDALNHKGDMNNSLEKMRTTVVERLNELRRQANTLDENMNSWAANVRSKMQETIESSTKFSTDLASHLAAVQAHMEAATNQQLQNLGTHSQSLGDHLDSERKVIRVESDKLIADIAGFVHRMVNDYASQAVRRQESAVAGFKAAVSAISDETKEFAAKQHAEFRALGTENKQWEEANRKSLEEGVKQSTSDHSTSTGTLRKVINASQDGETDLTVGIEATSGIVDNNHTHINKKCDEDISAAEAATAGSTKLTTRGTKEVQRDSEQLREKVQTHLDEFTETATRNDEVLQESHEIVRSHTEACIDDVFDGESDVIQYVMQGIKRDTQKEPPRKDYVYPQEYAATPEYAAILQDVPKDWQREAAIREGKLAPGQGPDFPGVPGGEDWSGVLTSTKHKDPHVDDAARLKQAAYESEVGEYSDPEGFVDPLDEIEEEEEEEEN